jgi:uncharacterized damage-inducible protein DinB
MTPSDEQIGRPRRYALSPAEGFANEDAAYFAAALDELTERHFDLVRPLPADVLHWLPAEGWYSVAMITAHMIQAEAGWVARVTGEGVPQDIGQRLSHWRDGAEPTATAADLEAMARRVRGKLTKRRLAGVANIDVEVPAGDRVLSVRGVLMHLVWHWTYHCGQTGLIRGMKGLEYQWRLDERVGGRD